MVVGDPRSQDRIEQLASRLHHPDPSQLFFQVTEIGGDQVYLRHGIEVGPGDVVFDVGANVGVAAVFFAALCGASAVHSFEPVGPICDLLRANVAGLDACVVHQQGLSDAAGSAEIAYYPGACAMSGLYADPARDRELVRTVLLNHGLSEAEAQERLRGRYEPQMLDCELTTVSAVLHRESIVRVSLLKIDVERAELDVLRGIDEPDWERIDQIVLEIHDEDGRRERVAETLRCHDFDVVCDQEPMMAGTGVWMLYARRP
jgi:FkbM family methyltransferase